MIDLDLKYKDLTKYLKDEIPFIPDLTLILGSGLGDFADNLEIRKSIPTSELPGYPISTVEGHKGFLHFAEFKNKKVLVFQGRIHIYEGYTIDKCVLPSFIAKSVGSNKLLITNAAGGINPNLKPGDLMLVTGFLSHNIKKEISRLFTTPSLDQRKSANNLPDPAFNQKIREASLSEGVFLKEGTYWFGKGPSYETPAEIRMQRIFGADAVGMSTVHEAIFAAYHRISVASISLITNYAAGISPTKLSHSEVIETADLAKVKFETLIKNIISAL